MMDESTGELIERRLEHESGEADAFYRNLPGARPLGFFEGSDVFRDLSSDSTIPG